MEQMDNKNEYQAALLKNRVAKNYRTLRKWARKNGVTCYRIYDRDIPEIPLSVDLYEFLPEGIQEPGAAARFVQSENEAESANTPGAAESRTARTYLKVFLYERPYEKAEAEEEAWLLQMRAALGECLRISEERIITRTRLRDKGGSQYAKDEAFSAVSAADSVDGLVFENGCVFSVRLNGQLDTGLFLDMRPLRRRVQKEADGKRVLNLFCYTAGFSLAAASGGAAYIESVDLSNTYIEWAKRNFDLNAFCADSGKKANGPRVEWFRADVMQYLDEAVRQKKKFDLIILDPPTFSNSKKARDDLDLNSDYHVLCAKCLDLLDRNGTLYFSTNSQRLRFDAALLPPGATAREITAETIDEDFKQKKSHRAWDLHWN